MADTTNKTNFIARTLFIIGGVILFIVLIVFIFKLIPILISGLSSTFGFGPKAKETIAITTNVEIAQTTSPVTVSFDHEATQAGEYFVSYSCVDGLFFDIQSSNGPRRIVCDTPFRLGTNLDSIVLVPLLTKANAFVDSTLKIEYKDAQDNPLDQGTKVLTVTSDASSTTATSTTENPFGAKAPLAGSTVTTTTLPTQTTTTTQVSTGTTYVSPTRDLTVSAIYPLANQSAFVMNVYNFGNTATGPWTFTYTDAENPSRTIEGPVQASLGAGQGMAVTVRFDGQVNASQVIAIRLNPYNQISETNTSNNTSSVTITGRTSGGNTGGSNNSDEDADFEITDMEVGRIQNGRFIEDDTIDADDEGAIRFTVQNIGGETTNSWRYEVENLPVDSSNDSYTSPTQSSLRPGEYVDLYVEFTGMVEGSHTIEVEVDSNNSTREERENNNTESERLTVND